ncbi:MAG: type II toxin-antitoxin system HipA family toxin [Cytophagales bacterium]|nr:type II toxin-antitoxin system HipA family toxin [Rhizobacter sp.]
MVTTALFPFAHLVNTGFVPAGRLRITQSGPQVEASEFAYGTQYLARAGRFELDPVSLALAADSDAKGQVFFPVNRLTQFGGIRDAAPDGWGRRVIEARLRAPVNSLPEATYLLEAGSERIGALDVRASLHAEPSHGVHPIHDLGYVLDASQRVDAGEPVPAGLKNYLGNGTAAAGGARPKATFRDEDGLLWLAKFPSVSDDKRLDIATIEHATLKLAALCGLTVPELRLHDIGGKTVLFIRRFDRFWKGDEMPPAAAKLHETAPGDGRSEWRLPFASGLTLVACDEYESAHHGYTDLAHAIRRVCHTACVKQDNRELFMRMVFNIFVSNDDDHLRNHGFVRDPRLGGWRLSPLYDVVPRPSQAFERRLHLEVGSRGKLATLDNAMTAHAGFIPDRPDAIAAVRQVWSVLRQWKGHFENFGVPGKYIDEVQTAMRDLKDISLDAALSNEIRRAPSGRAGTA